MVLTMGAAFLDRKLNVLRVDPDIGFQTKHRQLELNGVLDHPFSAAELERLKRGCTVVKGAGFQR